MTDRTIRLGMDADTIVNIAEITGNTEFCRALGYFMQWGLDHTYLELIGGVYDGNPEIIATYRKEERGPITYQIGAIWHGDHFGFHS